MTNGIPDVTDLPSDATVRSVVAETEVTNSETLLHNIAEDVQDDDRVRHVMFSEEDASAQIRLSDGRVDAESDGTVRIVGKTFDGVQVAFRELAELVEDYVDGDLAEATLATSIVMVDVGHDIDIDAVDETTLDVHEVNHDEWTPRVMFEEYPDTTITVFPNGQVVIDGVSSAEELETLTAWATSASFPRQ